MIAWYTRMVGHPIQCVEGPHAWLEGWRWLPSSARSCAGVECISGSCRCHIAFELTAHTDVDRGLEALLSAESQVSTLEEAKDDTCAVWKTVHQSRGESGISWTKAWGLIIKSLSDFNDPLLQLRSGCIPARFFKPPP
jgi:hypothetical protein